MTVTNARPTPQNQLTTDADWESFINGAGNGDGVIMSPSTSLAPALNTGARTLDLAAGQCLIKGKLWSTDATLPTAIPAASGQNRIDRLVMRLNRTATTAVGWINPVLIQGTPSGSPVEPALTQTPTGNWDIPICRWTSASSGALTGLVDERFDVGKTMISGLAANMPTWLIRPTLYYQTDTRIVQLWDGSAWFPITYVPTFYTAMPAMQNSWSIGDFAKYRLTGDGDLQVAFKHLNCGTTTDGTNIWAVGSVPAAFRPADFHRVPVYTDVVRMAGSNPESPSLEFCPDGSIQCFGIGAAAARLDCYAIIPINI